MKRVCVFCGSSPGAIPEYVNAARELGLLLVKNHIGLVYGGGRIGIMGAIAQTVQENGGEVIGVIPQALVRKEVAFTELSDLRIVNSMHERKAAIEKLSDGFIALSGGFGTFEEFFEVLTWAQLGIHKKPCALLNICGYFDKLITFIDHAVDQQFIEKKHQSLILISDKTHDLLKKMLDYKPPEIDKAQWALRMTNI